ncbi:unnamed protein product [Soboliphyme baturini]|uniref:Plastocyanin-like domain-containing protein n=1 Tax=Soboliphyme baturini TaxID=241478 RepID=A0A183IWB9_9BILA|nr:unnamed protein product [Soboliphyme baturini]
MVSTALLPYFGTNFKLSLATTLNHAMWYHSFNVPVDDWVLYEVEGVAAVTVPDGISRPAASGTVNNRNGRTSLYCLLP